MHKSVKTESTMPKINRTKGQTLHRKLTYVRNFFYFDTSIIIQLNVAEYIPPKNENVMYILLIDNLYP